MECDFNGGGARDSEQARLRRDGRDRVGGRGDAERVLSADAIKEVQRACGGGRVVDERGGGEAGVERRPGRAGVERAFDAIGGCAGNGKPCEGGAAVVERGCDEPLRRVGRDAGKIERVGEDRFGATTGDGERCKTIANGRADGEIAIAVGRSEIIVGEGRPGRAGIERAFERDAQIRLTVGRAPFESQRLGVEEFERDVGRGEEFRSGAE